MRSRWDSFLGFIQKVSDYLEGDAHTIGLRNNACFVAQWRNLVTKYSLIPPEQSLFFEGTNCDFLYLQTEIFVKDDLPLKLFERTFRVLVEDTLREMGFSSVATYSFLDFMNSDTGEWRVSVYFSTSDKQIRKLQDWYRRQIYLKRERALRRMDKELQDQQLEREMTLQEQETKNED